MDRIIQIIICGFILDCILGDPQNPFHPIRFIGKFIAIGIDIHRKMSFKSNFFSFCFGALLSIITLSLTFFISKILIGLMYSVAYAFGFLTEVLFCYFIIAPKALKTESMKVYKNIILGDLEKSRIALSYIVGRDTKNLTFPQIIKGAVETVAENLSDGVIAPLIFVFIGGVPLGMAYKAANTLDSMIGYRNQEFEYFGKFAAKLDDLLNFIPARISALMMIIAAFLTGHNLKNAIKIFIRDRYKHKSPNSAQTEAVCAGALGICLGGDNYYNGTLVHKPKIGDNLTEPKSEHIIEANRLMYVSTVLIIFFMILKNFLS